MGERQKIESSRKCLHGREIVVSSLAMSNITEGLDDETSPRLDSVQLRYQIMNIHGGVSARCFITPSTPDGCSVLRFTLFFAAQPPLPPPSVHPRQRQSICNGTSSFAYLLRPESLPFLQMCIKSIKSADELFACNLVKIVQLSFITSMILKYRQNPLTNRIYKKDICVGDN